MDEILNYNGAVLINHMHAPGVRPMSERLTRRAVGDKGRIPVTLGDAAWHVSNFSRWVAFGLRYWRASLWSLSLWCGVASRYIHRPRHLIDSEKVKLHIFSVSSLLSKQQSRGSAAANTANSTETNTTHNRAERKFHAP